MATQSGTVETGGHGAAAGSSVPVAARDTAEQTLSTAGATLRADLEHLGSCRLSGPAAARARDMLHGLAGNATALRKACRNAGVSPPPNRQQLPVQTLRKLHYPR